MSLKNLSLQVCKILKKTSNKNFIPLHEPSFNGNEWKFLKDCLDSTYVSSVGKYVSEFEKKISSFTNSKYCICMSSGTSALHLSIKVLNIKENDEVLIPSFSFVACANVLRYEKIIPHFVDISEETLGICPDKLDSYLAKITIIKDGYLINKKTNKIIKAIIPMHTFGHPANMTKILKIAKKYKLDIIEDAAEAIGSYYNDKHVGTFGKIGVFSFNGNKTITTGGGGAVITNSKQIADKIRYLSTTAKKNHKWEFIHDDIGYNYRMPNINAALGCAQIDQLKLKIKNKRALFKYYKHEFSNVPGIKLFIESYNCRSNYWLQTLILNSNNIKERNEILEITNSNGIQTRPAWRPIDSLKPFKDFPKMNLDNTYSLYNRVINIPSSDNLK